MKLLSNVERNGLGIYTGSDMYEMYQEVDNTVYSWHLCFQQMCLIQAGMRPEWEKTLGLQTSA